MENTKHPKHPSKREKQQPFIFFIRAQRIAQRYLESGERIERLNRRLGFQAIRFRHSFLPLHFRKHDQLHQFRSAKR